MSAPAPVNQPRRAESIPVHNGSNRITDQLGATITPGTLGRSFVTTSTHQIIQNIPGGQVARLPFPGISYYFEFIGTTGGIANNFAGLKVRPVGSGGTRPDVIHVMGTGLRFGTANFDALEITNQDPVNTVRFTIDIGGGVVNNSYDEYIDRRVVINTTTGGAILVATSVTVATGAVTIGNAPTTNLAFKTRVPAWADLLASGATQDVTGLGIVGKTRKSVIFSNDDAAAVLFVFDSSGNILGSVQPATAFYLETSDDIKLNNPSAGNVVCHIGEVYYQ